MRFGKFLYRVNYGAGTDLSRRKFLYATGVATTGMLLLPSFSSFAADGLSNVNLGTAGSPLGNWQVLANRSNLEIQITRDAAGNLVGSAIYAGGFEKLDNIAWDSAGGWLSFRRIGSGFWQWYRGKIDMFPT
ncbi:twin-arginine translocation signal domain-containing protein [Methylomagnum sp.]